MYSIYLNMRLVYGHLFAAYDVDSAGHTHMVITLVQVCRADDAAVYAVNGNPAGFRGIDDYASGDIAYGYGRTFVTERLADASGTDAGDDLTHGVRFVCSDIRFEWLQAFAFRQDETLRVVVVFQELAFGRMVCGVWVAFHTVSTGCRRAFFLPVEGQCDVYIFQVVYKLNQIVAGCERFVRPQVVETGGFVPDHGKVESVPELFVRVAETVVPSCCGGLYQFSGEVYGI